MKLTRILFVKRGWLRFPGTPPESFKLIRHGTLRWRDYQPRYIDPPYWYQWTTESPYSPQEQNKILMGESINWYKKNYRDLKVVAPDQWVFRVGDDVEVLVGKDKGKKGVVVQIVPQGNLIVVGGLHCKKTIRDGVAYNVEQPLQHDEVSLIDPVSKERTSVEFKVNEKGQRVRMSVKSGHLIPWPPELLADGTSKKEYVFGEKDTNLTDATTTTYKPSIVGWEEELNKAFGINDPPRRKTFWY